MHSLHNVLEMNANTTSHDCVRKFPLEKLWIDFDEIWYVHYATGGYSSLYFWFPIFKNITMANTIIGDMGVVLLKLWLQIIQKYTTFVKVSFSL
jgi:hypothetical protein